VKLCIVTHRIKKGDGQGRVNYEVALEALRRGHELTLVASEISPELEKNSLVNWISIPVNNLPSEFLRNFVFALKSANWLRKYRSQVDVVKVNGAITIAASDVNAVHFVHTSWLSSSVHISRTRRDLYGFYQWLYTAINSYSEKQAFKKAKVVIAVSEKVARELVNLGVPCSQIRVILNGVDLQEFYPDVAPDVSQRQKLGLPEDVTLGLFAGDIRTSRKNLDTVLHALVKAPNLHLIVVGNPEGSPFPQLAKSLGLSDRVHFVGYRRDIADIMRAVDLFVFPSRYEACTLVLLEALSSGLPVITAQATGGAELVTSECGFVLNDTDDSEALATALNTLSNDAKLRQQMGQAARNIALQHSWATMAASYIDLFEDLSKNKLTKTHINSKFKIPYGKTPVYKIQN
jgi:glycosyltransferase involved in cell wall biosynthesis